MVIVLFESIDFILCILQRKKPVNVQKYISEAPVKRFDKCVVSWFPGLEKSNTTLFSNAYI
jgi:hypothetical protein